MEFKVTERYNYSHQPIKTLWLQPHEFENGVKYARENNIKSLFLRSNEQKTETIDFSWLIEIPEIHTLQIMIHLSKKSNIDSIYKLKGLKDLAYFENYDRMPLDHNKLKTLEHLYLRYSKNLKLKECSFELLENLKSLKLLNIKDEENCIFIGRIKKLEYLEFSRSRSLKTLEGIENCKTIKSLSLRNLSQLENINSLNKLEILKGLWVENCKKINDEGKKILIKKDEEYKNNGVRQHCT